FPRFAKVSVSSIRALESDIYTDSGDFYPMVTIDENMIRTNQATLDWRDTYKLGRLRQRIGDIIPREMAYGYAITGHKAQGSEWDKVLVYEENFPFNEEEHARWLYTCITRASDKLVLVRQ
ncbi:MAG: ATP-binding domain-containing protein, partial [Bacilli bacterium]|nr:ATP-binding domain-containing protein [Bacilli bacterium]